MAKDVDNITTITDATNAVIVPKGGDSFELQNMKGNELIAFLPEGYFPKAIKVFNGIAYIVSNKYGTDGAYEYTEIGTYPSPEWSALFPDKIEITNSDASFYPITQLESLSSFIESNDIIASNELQRVYSFEVGVMDVDYNTVTYDSWGTPTTHVHHSKENFYGASKLAWAGKTGSSRNCNSTDFPGPEDYGYISHSYFEFKVIEDGADKTSEYVDHLNIDIIRIDKYAENESDLHYRIFSDFILEYSSTYNSYVLKKYTSDTSYNGNFYNGLELRHLMCGQKTYGSCGGRYECFENDGNTCSVLNTNNSIVDRKWMFIVKIDGSKSKDVHFFINQLSLLKASNCECCSVESSYRIRGIGLNTGDGKYYKVNDSWNTDNDYQSALNTWIAGSNTVTANKNYPTKSRLIFARQKITNTLLDSCSCGFGGELGEKNSYIAINPLFTEKRTYTDNYNYNISVNKENEFDASKIISPLLETYTSNLFDKSLSFKIAKYEDVGNDIVWQDGNYLQGLPNTSGNNILIPGTNHKLYTNTGNGTMVIKLDVNNIGDDFIICYCNDLYNSSHITDYNYSEYRKYRRSLIHIFDTFFHQFDDNNMEFNDSRYSNVPVWNWYSFPNEFVSTKGYHYEFFKESSNNSYNYDMGTYLDKYTVLRMFLSQTPILSEDINNYAPNQKYLNDSTYNGIEGKISDYFTYAYDNIFNLTEQSAFSNNTQLALSTKQGLLIWRCVVDGDTQDLSVDISGACECESSYKNVLLKINYSYNGSISDPVKILLASIDAYTGSMERIYSDGPFNEEYIMLFKELVPDTSSINITILCDTNGVLDDSVFEIEGYYYCNEEKYSHLKDKYCPLFNFNGDMSLDDAYFIDSQNSNYPFRSNIFTKDNNINYELEIEASYDNTVNLIINDKKSKVKLINSRFSFDPSNKRCFIPQQYGFNDDNVYQNKNIHFTELIRRKKRVLNVEFDDLQAGGQLHGGSYTYYFRYVDSDGNVTDIINHTLPISVFNIEDEEADNVGENAGVNTNASVKLILSSFDMAYKHIEVSFVYNAGELNTAQKYYKINKKYDIPLSNKLVIIHTGFEELKDAKYNDIALSYNHHDSVHSIAQGKKRLLLSNITLSDISMYSEIKRLASDMLTIKEVNVKTSTDFYKNSKNATDFIAYWKGETYQLGFSLSQIKGGETPIFNPRGLDNISGNISYSDNVSINGFNNVTGENPYGVYRTKMYDDLTTGNSQYFNHTVLVIEGMKDFLNTPVVKSIANGYTIYKKERIKDVLVEGYTVPVFKAPIGSGAVINYNSSGVPETTQPDTDTAYVKFDNSHVIDSCIVINDTGLNKYHIAPFGLIQQYHPLGSTSSLDDIGYVDIDGTGKSDGIAIINLIINQNTEIKNKFGFVSGDLIVDAEHYAADFQGKNKFYMVNKEPIIFYFDNGIGYAYPFNVVDNANNVFVKITGVSNIKLSQDNVISLNTESIYVSEGVDVGAPDSFASKLDQTNINFSTISFIGVTEDTYSGIGRVTDIVQSNYSQGSHPYGFLTRVYRKENGVIKNSDWQVLYSSNYNEGAYYPITETINLYDGEVYNPGASLSKRNLRVPNDSNYTVPTDIVIDQDLLLFGGDCFLSKSYYNILSNNDSQSFDSYADIWKYTAGVGSTDFEDKEFNKEDPAANSWIEDNEFMAIKRARIIRKGLWIELIHESNYNLALRSTEYKSPQEKTKYQKDRTFLSSSNKIDSYIPSVFGSSQIESKGYNKGYSYFKGILSNSSFKDAEKLLRAFYTRVEITDVAVKGELKNGYRELFGLNYKDYDTKYGYISKIISFNNNVFAIFENGVAYIPLGEKTQVSDADGGVYIENVNILGKELTILSESNGTIHPDSCKETKTGIYFYDHNNLAIMNIHGSSVPTDISSFKVETFLREFKSKLEYYRDVYENGDRYINYNVKTNYDILTGDIIFTFYIYEDVKDIITACDIKNVDIVPNNDNKEYTDVCDVTYQGFGCNRENEEVNDSFDDEVINITTVDCEPVPTSKSPITIYYQSSIYYNERIAKWVSPISFNPNFVFSLEDKTYSMNLVENQNRIHVHDSDNVNFCFFYDEQHNFSFEFVINQEQQFQKVLENLMLITNEHIPVTISYDVDIKRDLNDTFDSSGSRVRDEYDLDLVQDVKTRRFEVKMIGLSHNTDFGIYLNTNDYLVHHVDINDTFAINGTQYQIVAITSTLTDEGIMMPLLTINYYDGVNWFNVDTIKGNEIYNQLFGFTLKISKINITRSNSDYIEDHMYIQVQLKKTDDGWREIRGRDIKVRINYDGIDKTFIHSVISTVEQSLN